MTKNSIIILAGPTAAGKSHLALAIAQEYGAVIINADSMQLYDAIPILSAQPSIQEQQQTPHLLYGVLDSNSPASAGLWVEMARKAIDDTLQQGKFPLLVGGTGLYLKTLIYGISPIPDIQEDIRIYARGLLTQLGNTEFHALLTKCDPVMAERLHAGDSQRMVRSLEVIEQTGISLAEWQKVPAIPFYPPEQFIQLTLIPPRPILYHNCNERLIAMIQNGALDEVRALVEAQIDPSLPVMKALGVPELRQYVEGIISLEDSITQAQTSTRHYAKRQLTWFRHQMPESRNFAYEGTEEERQKIMEECLINYVKEHSSLQ